MKIAIAVEVNVSCLGGRPGQQKWRKIACLARPVALR